MERSSTKEDDNKLLKVFFYGTLKRNEPNDMHLNRLNCKFVCEAVTVDKYPLVVVEPIYFPFMVDHKGVGKVNYHFFYFVVVVDNNNNVVENKKIDINNRFRTIFNTE